jgi:hypothetical protein
VSLSFSVNLCRQWFTRLPPIRKTTGLNFGPEMDHDRVLQHLSEFIIVPSLEAMQPAQFKRSDSIMKWKCVRKMS